MTHVSATDSDTVQDSPFATPTFDSRSAFAWTLRAGEVERRRYLQQRPVQAATPRWSFTRLCRFRSG